MNTPHHVFDPFIETTPPLSGLYMWNRREWLEQRVASHIEDALTFHRIAKRDLRRGERGWANDNRRICARHLRMAKHYRETLKGLAG